MVLVFSVCFTTTCFFEEEKKNIQLLAHFFYTWFYGDVLLSNQISIEKFFFHIFNARSKQFVYTKIFRQEYIWILTIVYTIFYSTFFIFFIGRNYGPMIVMFLIPFFRPIIKPKKKMDDIEKVDAIFLSHDRGLKKRWAWLGSNVNIDLRVDFAFYDFWFCQLALI